MFFFRGEGGGGGRGGVLMGDGEKIGHLPRQDTDTSDVGTGVEGWTREIGLGRVCSDPPR